ncbi:glycosyltransferase [Streptomyces sp. L7]
MRARHPRSLRANAHADFEFILVDDCSRDGTPRHSRARSASCRERGVCQTREERRTGDRAQHRDRQGPGEYLTFLDGDDWLAPVTSPNWSTPSRSWAATSCARTMSSAPRGPGPSSGCRTAGAGS